MLMNRPVESKYCCLENSLHQPQHKDTDGDCKDRDNSQPGLLPVHGCPFIDPLAHDAANTCAKQLTCIMRLIEGRIV